MDYDRARATAARLLANAKQGQVVLTRAVAGEPDPDQPWVPVEPSEQTEDLNAVVKGVSSQFVDGTTVLASDLEVLCAPPVMGAKPTDGLTIDGDAVTVLRVTPIPAAGEPAALRLIVRG